MRSPSTESRGRGHHATTQYVHHHDARRRLPSGETIPVLGMGTWHLGEGRHPPEVEIEALRTGIDLGMTLVDTAEMYGDGAERAARRPGDRRTPRRGVPRQQGAAPATRRATGRSPRARRACGAWAPTGSTSTSCTGAGRSRSRRPSRAFEELKRAGAIRHWGVSNFDLADMTELCESPAAARVQTDQVLYNLAHRGIEWNLLPWSASAGLPIMAYSPIEQGRLVGHPVLRGIGRAPQARPRRRSRWRGSSRTPASARSPRPARPSTCARTPARSGRAGRGRRRSSSTPPSRRRRARSRSRCGNPPPAAAGLSAARATPTPPGRSRSSGR